MDSGLACGTPGRRAPDCRRLLGRTGPIKAKHAMGYVWVLLAACGCARDPSPSAANAQHAKISFDAARERCGVTVAETTEVQRCMRAQGWAYRLPWQ